MKSMKNIQTENPKLLLQFSSNFLDQQPGFISAQPTMAFIPTGRNSFVGSNPWPKGKRALFRKPNLEFIDYGSRLEPCSRPTRPILGDEERRSLGQSNITYFNNTVPALDQNVKFEKVGGAIGPTNQRSSPQVATLTCLKKEMRQRGSGQDRTWA
ncbi:unnamed protein product [Dovyalis caffra]|uniref:Ribosomal protein S18 n=1 Tax=Dovyalis caffra TaxID=77055 RepID=A0AAV1QVK3_9ROSI|nr:unnamed protein product [Dovyalis caffra]